MTKQHTEALDLLQLNFSVVPVGKIKKPIIPWKEFQVSLPTKEEVVLWWETYPDANVGIITGKVSHLLVVDIDPRNGGTDEMFAGIETVSANTPSGGKHLYFRLDEPISNKIGFYPGIDIRADGGFVVAPPSVVESGEYSWINEPGRVPLAKIPKFVLDKLFEETVQNAKDILGCVEIKGATAGSRNATTTKAIGQILALSHIEDWETKGWEKAKQFNETNSPPLDETELRKIFESIKRSEQPKKIARYNSMLPQGGLDPTLAERNPHVYQWDEFIKAKPEESGTWFVDNLIKPGWLVVIGGHGKQGKTTLVIHLLNALRLGKPFIFNTNPCPVLFLNCEMQEDDLRELIEDVSVDSPVGETALIVSPIKPLDINYLYELLKSQPKPGLCVIDSFRGAFMLENDYENQAGTVGLILRKLQNIARETKWTILVIHHFNKEGTGNPSDLAGSGEWTSAPDAIITWVCPQYGKPGKLAIIGRIPPIEEQLITLERKTIEFQGERQDFNKQAKIDRIMEIIRGEGGTFAETIVEKTKYPNGTVQRILDKLAVEGVVKKIGKGVRNDPYSYILPEVAEHDS